MADNSPEQLRIIADAIPYPVMYILADGTVGFTNRALQRANGFRPEDADGKSVEDVLSAEENDAGRDAFARCLTQGRRVYREGPSRTPDGETYYCRYVYEPVRSAEGRVLGVCVTVVNLTDIKNAEEALRASHADLKRSNRDLEQFAYVASHDLKAPLRSIEVLAGWLSEDLADYTEGDVQENLELLKTRTTRLNRLLDDLLTYSRVGRRVGEIGAVDTEALVRDVFALIAPEDRFSLQFDGAMPEITTFRGPLEQVFRNLVSNAVKHHPGPQGCITVGAQPIEEGFVFSVADDGAGIPEEYSERIYQMFQTLQPRDDVEGSGMGLAIVARVVEWQGGRIWHEPAPSGTGTVFKFEWKAVDEGTAQRIAESGREHKDKAA